MTHQVLSVCRDRHSLAFYRKVVRLLPKRIVFDVLSQVKEAQVTGRIKESSGVMFTDLIKRKANELGIKFGKESNEVKTELQELIEERTEMSPPSEAELANRMAYR